MKVLSVGMEVGMFYIVLYSCLLAHNPEGKYNFMLQAYPSLSGIIWPIVPYGQDGKSKPIIHPLFSQKHHPTLISFSSKSLIFFVIVLIPFPSNSSQRPPSIDIFPVHHTARRNHYNPPFNIESMSSGNAVESEYKPFRYPPDYNLARIHQLSSMPGKPRPSGERCPCCEERLKDPFKSWWDRSIEKDFKGFGGAVVGYFWLIKLYALAIIAIIVIYGAYLQYLTNYYCQNAEQLTKEQACARLFGVWIVTNKDLKMLIVQEADDSTLSRFQTLRGVLFLLLLVVNVLSLYVIKWFKVRHPDKPNVSNFSILFKNLRNDRIDDLLKQLQAIFGKIQIKEAFIIKKIEPFYTAYQQKLELYYNCKIEESPKKLGKMRQKLYGLDQFCCQNEESFYNQGNRAILVFNDLTTKEQVLARYEISRLKVIKMFFSNDYQQEFGMYCEPCPRPEEILWKNIGIMQKQGLKVKVLSVIYFLLILTALVAFLFFFMNVVYVWQIDEPFKGTLTNIILLFLVFVALTFRAVMNQLSEMRYPNTFTNRAMFIVITTVLFHFIFYLLIPNLYLFFHDDLRGAILGLISNQAINFIIVQVTLAGFDLMYCCWNRAKRQTQNQDRPIGCQKILHQKMQFPRFPLQFKLIILFKIWSLITFFAFQVPLVLFLIFVALVYLYVKDKMNIYYHYRMEMIDNGVQFKFLQLYANVFSVYLFTTFIITQNEAYEIIIGGGATILAILVQIIYFRRLRDHQPSSRDSLVTLSIDGLDHVDSYQGRYQKFLDEARDDLTDTEIREYLSKIGYGTMKTEESLGSNVESNFTH